MPELPQALKVSDLGDRLRGELRLAPDPASLRGVQISLPISVVALLLALFLGNVRLADLLGSAAPDLLLAPALGIIGFVGLLLTATFGSGAVRFPTSFEINDRAFVLGDDEHLFRDLANIVVEPGDPGVAPELRWHQTDGSVTTWAVSEGYTEPDIVWLADAAIRGLFGNRLRARRRRRRRAGPGGQLHRHAQRRPVRHGRRRDRRRV